MIRSLFATKSDFASGPAVCRVFARVCALSGVFWFASAAPAQDFQFDQLPSAKSKNLETESSRLQPLSSQITPRDSSRVVNADYLGSQNAVSQPQYVGTASVRMPNSATYRLRRLTSEQFEHAVVNCWMSQPAAELMDGGRRVRVWLPGFAEGACMVIDRADATLGFEGPTAMAEAWQAAVVALDESAFSPGNATVRIVELGSRPAGEVNQTAFVTGAAQEPQLPQPNQQDDNITKAVQLNPQQDRQPPQIITQETLPGQGQTLVGNVTIQVFEDQNLIILIGPKEDVAIVEKAIREIYQTAGVMQPKIERVPLANSDPTTTAEQVQAVYDAIYANSLGTARVTAIQEPRGLLIIGREEAIKTIKEIITQFDVTGTDTAITFHTFQLKYMSAIDAKQRVDEYFSQAAQSPLASPPPSLPVVTIADFRSNQLIVKASKNYIDQVSELLTQLDTADTAAIKSVKIFKLRNTVAQDIQLVLQDALNGQQGQSRGQGFNPNTQAAQFNQFNQFQAQTQPGQSTLGSTGLQLKTFDRQGNEIRSGILFDVRVSADNSSNSLVVSAPESAMQLIETLILQLDQIPNAETQIKVFQIINGDAQTLLTMLQTLFASATQAGGAQFGGQFGQAGGAALSQLPLQNASATEGQTLVNLRLAIDQRTNSIIVSGPVGDLEVVEALLTRLDEDDLNLREVVVYRLSNAPVLDVSDSVNAWIDERATVTNADPSYISQIIQNRRQIIVVPEVVSNSLIVSATSQFMPEILGVIRSLDRRPPVVKVKVLIAEVNLTMLEEFGIEMGVQDSLVFDRGLSNIRYPFNQSGIGNDNSAASLATRELLAGQALSNLAVGRVNSNLGYGGMVISAGNESINLLIRALLNKNCVRVLSTPEITTIENQQGRVQVGARAPYVTGVTQTNFGITNEVELQDVGIILQVTPRVSPDGMIVMYVDATRSRLGDEEDGVAVFISSDGQVVRQPQILTTTAQTTIMARSGQTVAFAGLIQELKTTSTRGTPILSDLPFIGPLFRFEQESAFRNELLIIMTPYIVDSDEELEAHNHEDMDRMHWCLCDVAEVYGGTVFEKPPHYSTPEIFYPDRDPTGSDPYVPEQPAVEPGMDQNLVPGQAIPPGDQSKNLNQNPRPNQFRRLFSLKKPANDN